MIPHAFLLTIVLPVGVEVDGQTHTECEIGPITMAGAMVADVEAAEPPPAGLDEETWRGMCRAARNIRRLGTLPPETFTGRWLLEMAEADGTAIFEAAAGVRARANSFRKADGGPAGGAVSGGEGDGLDRGGAAPDA